MKLTFFGTSHGAPEVGAFCSGTLLETGEASYLIDCGAPVDALMINKGKSFEQLRGIFITHMHEDHVGTLPAMLKEFGHYHPTAHASFFLPEENGVEALLTWFRAMHESPDPERVHIGVSQPGVFFEDEDIRIAGILTDHIPGYPTYSYSIELKKEGKRVLFSGDVAADLHDFPEEARTQEWDVVVSELTHYHIKDYMDVFQAVKTKQLIFNHKNKRNLGIIEQLVSQFPYPVHIVKDGDELEF